METNSASRLVDLFLYYYEAEIIQELLRKKDQYAANMDIKNKCLSLHFYNYLCNVIGSPDVIKARRNILIWQDLVTQKKDTFRISSGSKAEGIDQKGSDYDEMFLFNTFRVYESFHDVQLTTKKITFNMETNDTKPGFIKLKLADKVFLDIDIIFNWCETVGNEIYISSKRFREHFLKDDMIIHGPCLSTAGGEFDIAFCFRCKEWITTAEYWIHRSRPVWPHHTLDTSLVQYGVLFVPIGCKNSPNEDIQWRISFSVTEKLLIHSFSHTQLLCYALMKIMLQDIIKPKHGDLLCSYFLKTIMFWLSEEISPSEWKPENLFSCFIQCIRRLIYCVEYKTCLHYFIPENNLFEDRFTDIQHNAFLDTLRFIYGKPWTVFETSTFQNYRFESARISKCTY
ncbi:protein mab-21-like [Mytilus edulis]|uniref:protein mab-21-like n=1 Tax=Mytilus edulis TaxID=6550 RepID=UPI0039EF9101